MKTVIQKLFSKITTEAYSLGDLNFSDPINCKMCQNYFASIEGYLTDISDKEKKILQTHYNEHSARESCGKAKK